jgi:hypothetical protein
MLDPISASNMIQYRQVPISGHVGKTPVVSEITVEWPYPFTVAPRRRTRTPSVRTSLSASSFCPPRLS